jgi:hypothetical protein
MNHWQRQWLSDRLHKKHEDTSKAEIPILPAPAVKKRQPKGKSKGDSSATSGS